LSRSDASQQRAPSSRITVWITLVFAIAILLRVGLSLVNQEANDDHYEVSKIIISEQRLPTKDDCWQCYHAKLYHSTAAAALNFIPLKTKHNQIILLQLMNCVAGLITISIVWLFLKKQHLTDQVRLLCFSLVALNPKFIGINSQVTNDSFVILFSTAALYYAYYFFGSKGIKHFNNFNLLVSIAD